MTKRPQAILIDRLAAALALKGVKLKRSQLLEVASAAFGYHNSHEFIAAAKRGSLTPVSAEPVADIELSGTQLTILRDPEAGALYALETSFLEQVAADAEHETFGPSPYGSLLSLERALDEHIPTRQAAEKPTTANTAQSRIAELEEQVAWLELRLSNAKVFQPDWRSWDRDLKKASVRDATPLDDESLGRLRHALADVHCKSTASERLAVEYRSTRFADKVLRRLLARLDQAEGRGASSEEDITALKTPGKASGPFQRLQNVLESLAHDGHPARFELADVIESIARPGANS